MSETKKSQRVGGWTSNSLALSGWLAEPVVKPLPRDAARRLEYDKKCAQLDEHSSSSSTVKTNSKKRSRSPERDDDDDADAPLVLPNFKEIKEKLEKHFGRPLQVVFSFQIESDYELDKVTQRIEIPDDMSQLLLRVDDGDDHKGEKTTKFAYCLSQDKIIRGGQWKRNPQFEILFETLNRHWRSTTTKLPELEKIENFVIRFRREYWYAQDFIKCLEHLDKHKYEDFTIEYPICLPRHDPSLAKTIVEVCTDDNIKKCMSRDLSSYQVHWIDVKDKDHVFSRTQYFDEDNCFYYPVEILEVRTPSKSVRILEEIKEENVPLMDREQLVQLFLELKKKDNLRVTAPLPSHLRPLPSLNEIFDGDYGYDRFNDDGEDFFVDQRESRMGGKVRTPRSNSPTSPEPRSRRRRMALNGKDWDE